jgi:hypothetical protein
LIGVLQPEPKAYKAERLQECQQQKYYWVITACTVIPDQRVEEDSPTALAEPAKPCTVATIRTGKPSAGKAGVACPDADAKLERLKERGSRSEEAAWNSVPSATSTAAEVIMTFRENNGCCPRCTSQLEA